MIFLTTTAIDLDEELLNRCLVLNVNEDRQQTQAIHRLQREQQTIEGLLAKQERKNIHTLHRNAQRLLKPLFVANPYAGRKDRHIPGGERALAWLGKYIAEVRPELLAGTDDGTVFLNNFGEPFQLWQVTHLVSDYVRKAQVGKTGSCHLFRHTVATLMLENGADVRVNSGTAGAREPRHHADVYAGLDQSAEAGVCGNASGRQSSPAGGDEGTGR
jgi:integrase